MGWAPTPSFGGLQAIIFFTPATLAVVTLITAEAMCYKVTNSVVFVKASAQDGTKKTPVATATGAFTSPF